VGRAVRLSPAGGRGAAVQGPAERRRAGAAGRQLHAVGWVLAAGGGGVWAAASEIREAGGSQVFRDATAVSGRSAECEFANYCGDRMAAILRRSAGFLSRWSKLRSCG